MENYYYVYETQNLTNGKKYIGQHCTHDLNDGYYGSCKELKRDIKSGHQYKVTILKWCKDIYELGNLEYDLIKERDCISRDDYYNTTNSIYHNKLFVNGHTKKSKEKISKNNAWKHNKITYGDKISKSLKESKKIKNKSKVLKEQIRKEAIKLPSIIYKSKICSIELIEQTDIISWYKRTDGPHEVFIRKFLTKKGQIPIETYPCTNDFGNIAWCYANEDEARKKYMYLKHNPSYPQ